jgi:hypothetical protein
VGSICSAERAAMRVRVIFISKHRFSSRRSQGGLEPIFESIVHWRKVGDCRQPDRP